MIWHVSLKIPPRGIRIGFWIKVESQVRHDTPRDSCTLLFCRLNAFLYLMICQMFHAHQNPVMFSINDRNTEGNEWVPCNFVLPTARCLKPSTSMENFWHRRGSRCWKKCERYRRERNWLERARSNGNMLYVRAFGNKILRVIDEQKLP